VIKVCQEIVWITCFTFPSLVLSRIEYALPVWGGYLNAELTDQINYFLSRYFKYGFCNAVAKVEQLLEKSDQKMFWVIQNHERRIHTLLLPSKDSDRYLRPRGHNYQ